MIFVVFLIVVVLLLLRFVDCYFFVVIFIILIGIFFLIFNWIMWCFFVINLLRFVCGIIILNLCLLMVKVSFNLDVRI